MQKRAIIVDNEPASNELIEKVLHSVGIESLVLNRSTEAPSILREGKFAVAFFWFADEFAGWSGTHPADAGFGFQSHDAGGDAERRSAPARDVAGI
jgi:hypothetical protein